MRPFLRYGVGLVLLSLLAGACGSGDDSPAATNLETRFDVTAQPDAVVLEENLVEDRLIESDPIEGEFRFRGSADDLGSVAVGDALVLGGVGFGIVNSIREEDGETVLMLGEASLGEIIHTGTLEWDYDVSWSDLDFSYQEAAYGPVMAAIIPIRAETSRKTTVSFEHQGWKFSIELEPKDERLNVKLDGSHGQASISAVGWVSGFKYRSNLEYADGSPTEMSTEINGLKGEMELKWAAFRTPQQALTDIVKFNAPLSLPIPLPGTLRHPDDHPAEGGGSHRP